MSGLICCLCGLELVTQSVTFKYMGHTFSADMPKCMNCGTVYISEEIATGKMAEVERQLEEK